MPRRLFLFPLVILAGVVACERAATDPTAVEEQLARLRSAAPANTLPNLFQDALLVTERRHGAAALTDLLAGWVQRQAEVQAAHAAGDATVAQARLKALRNEELRIVVHTLGPQVVTRVLTQTTEALTTTRLRVMEAAQQGINTRRAENSVAEVNQMLSRATALAAGDPLRALAIATDAAAQLAGIEDMAAELRRVRAVEDLFPEVAATLPPADLRHHARLHGEAHSALRGGHRILASEKLDAVRAEEIRLVLHATQNRASAQLLRQLAHLSGELQRTLRARGEDGRDVVRLQRMYMTATDLQNRARLAEASGDHATALDLGSHAAGLLNSLRHLLAY